MKLLITAAAAIAALAAGLLVFRSPLEEQRAAAEHPRDSPRFAAGAEQAGPPALVESRVDPLPEDATEFVKRAREFAPMPPDAEREKALRILAQEWAEEDPSGAERWAASLEDPTERERALTHVCLKVAEGNPREAASIAQWHRINEGVVEAIASRWAETDFEAAVAWVGDFTDAESWDRVVSRLVLARAATAPDEAAAIVSESLPAGEVQQEAAIAVLHQWLMKDPEAARQWVEAFPEGELKERAMGEIRGMMTYSGGIPAE